VNPPVVGLTGATGFLGTALTAALTRRGARVVALRLGPLPKLDRPTIEALLAGAGPFDRLINCAADKRPRDARAWFVNAELPGILAALAGPGRLIHVSTANVDHPDQGDPYTESKRAGERGLAAGGATVLRPGLIWSWSGQGDGALFARYLDLPLPWHPMLSPGNRYRPVLVGDLAEAIAELALSDRPPEIVRILGDRACSLFDLFADYAAGRRRRALPLALGWLGRLPGALTRPMTRHERLIQLLPLDRTRSGPVPGIRSAARELVLPFPPAPRGA